MAMPQECGDEPPPDDGWFPAHGVVPLGEVRALPPGVRAALVIAIMNW